MRELGAIHLEFVVTIVLDGAVIIAAILVRWGIVALLRYTTPADTHTWAVRALEWIADVGVVTAAGTFAAFDLVKRVLQSWRRLRRVWQGADE